MLIDKDVDGDYVHEYGDAETHAFDADTSDLFPHQFMSTDYFDCEDMSSPNHSIQKYECEDVETHTVDADNSNFSSRDDEQGATGFVFARSKCEHADVETQTINVDTIDPSPHQFIASDEALDVAINDVDMPKILSAEAFDRENVPSPDNFLQISTNTKHMPLDDGEQYECADVEARAIYADTYDVSPNHKWRTRSYGKR